jgi:hypothetical protein
MLRPTIQSASLSWNKASIWGLRPGLYYCQTVAGLLIRKLVSVVLLKTPLHGPNRKHRFQQYIYCCIESVSAGTCLPSYLETALVYLLISRSLRSNGSTRYNIGIISEHVSSHVGYIISQLFTTIKLPPAATLLTSIPEVAGSNLGREMD